MSAQMIAALYVETAGCYFGQPNIDPWDAKRDARSYAGPWPVVAHPPCQRWGSMAFVNFARWGGEHNRPGNDGGCFDASLRAVRNWGGVIEHPAKSRAWDAYGLTKPIGRGWQRCLTGGWVCEVWQSAYGHRANKATWLYYFGETFPPQLRWDRPVGSHQVGFHDQRGLSRNKPTLSRKEANATPVEFRDVLIALAARSAVSPSIEDARREELEVENKKLLTFAHEATKLLTFLSGGGSEMFRGVVRDVHLADLPACKARIERNRQALQELNDLRRRKAIEALAKSEAE